MERVGNQRAEIRNDVIFGQCLRRHYFFCCFEKFFSNIVFLPSFIVVRHQMAELTWGAFLHGPRPK